MSTAVYTRPSTINADGRFISPAFLIKTEKLTAKDRCDSCHSAAMVRVLKDGKQLLFCGNHARFHLSALLEQGWLVDDQTYQAFDTQTVN